MSKDEAQVALPLSVPVNDPASIRAELAAICRSTVFADSERLCAFLTFVEAYLEGNTVGLKETVIGSEVYRRAAGYNPKTDAIVRTEARRLRQKLDEYYAVDGRQSGIVIRLPKGGYVPQIERRTQPEVPRPMQPAEPGLKWIWILAAVSGAAIAGIVLVHEWGLWATGGRGESQSDAWEAVPFARGGSQAQISPDGSRIAYRCGGREGRICILTRTTGTVETFGKPARDNDNPVWSPDGKSIAYLGALGLEQAEIILRSLASGSERTVAVIGTVSGNYGGSLSWSPDPGSLIVTANLTSQESFGLFLVSIATGELRRLTTPRAMGRPFGDHCPAISPVGKWLAFSRVHADGLADLYVLELDAHLIPAGEPRKLDTGHFWNMTPAWTADGQELVFSTGTFRKHHLERLSVFEHEPPRRIAVGMEGSAESPAIGKDSSGQSLLAFTGLIQITNLWEVPVGRSGAASRQLTAPSSSRDFQPSYNPAGRGFTFVSDRSGYEEVWVAEEGGANPIQWTDMRCPKVAIPRWSPDGKRITFSAVCGDEGDIYTVSGPHAKPVRLTSGSGLDENSRWFPGGGWIYFTSFRSGVSTTWKVPDSGGPAQPISSRLTSNPQFSKDGRSLYFTRLSGGTPELWKTPAGKPGAGRASVGERFRLRCGRFRRLLHNQ